MIILSQHLNDTNEKPNCSERASKIGDLNVGKCLSVIVMAVILLLAETPPLVLEGLELDYTPVLFHISLQKRWIDR